MFRVHTPIIRSTGCWVAACDFLHRVFGWVVVLRPTQRLSRPPPIQKLGAENHMLRLNIQCSWWWAYVPETCRAKNTSIKLLCCIKLAFHIISWVRCTVKQPSCCTLSEVYCTPHKRRFDRRLFSRIRMIVLYLKLPYFNKGGSLDSAIGIATR